MEHRHEYMLCRHGQSVANVSGTIVSTLNEGVDPKYGLTELGREQAQRAGDQLCDLAVHRPIVVLSSPFSRALQTAEEIMAKLRNHEASLATGTVFEVLVDDRLRERYFGRFDGQSSECYNLVWERDASGEDTHDVGVESACEVSERMLSVVREAERGELKTSSSCTSADVVGSVRRRRDDAELRANELLKARDDIVVVLVAHGDALQILSTAFHALPPSSHRQLPHLNNASLCSSREHSRAVSTAARINSSST